MRHKMGLYIIWLVGVDCISKILDAYLSNLIRIYWVSKS